MGLFDGYDEGEVLGLLRSHGLVATPQRIKMLAYCLQVNRRDRGAVESVKGYFEEIDEGEGKDIFLSSRVYSALVDEGYYISLSTIYKNICLFKKLGLIDSDRIDN